jgi:subtilisin-like proprotein convertase family protein
MSARLLAAMIAALFALTAAEAFARPHNPFVTETPLQQAREEAGAGRPLQRTDLLPAGLLRLSESELLATTGQTLGFTVTLDRDVESARLEVDLPARWIARSGVSGIRYAKVPESGRRARRSGRTVGFAFADGKAGDEATFSLTDIGIPPGDYELPYRWTQRGGKSASGSVKVRFYAPTREAQVAEPEWSRLASPGFERNATNNATGESETFLTVVPGDRHRFLVGANSDGPYSAWITNDGGTTFTKATFPSATDAPDTAVVEAQNQCCDPMSAADAEGNIWYGGLSRAVPGPSRIVVNRIAPGETSFQPLTTGLPEFSANAAAVQDKPMMTIDNSPSSPRHGTLYVVWDMPQSGVNVVISQCATRPGGVLDAARCDDADNWTDPVSVAGPAGGYIYADVATGPDGTVYVVWWDYSSANAIRGDACGPTANCATAAAWGTTAGDKQTIAQLDNGTGAQPIPFECPIVAQPGGRASTSPQVDVDISDGPNRGRVYVTWSDLRANSGTTRCAENVTPLVTHDSFDNFVASAPGALPGSGAPSASVATRLLTEGEGGGQANSDDWFAWLAVDQTTGQAWADFYSTRDDATRKTTNFYVRSVTPSGGGHTLGALNKVSGSASDYSTNPCCEFGNDYGDYTGIDATDGIAFPIWSDKRPGDGEAFTFIRAEPVPAAGTPVIDDAAGDGDGVLEPGERFALTQPLRNEGSLAATGVSATLDGGTDIAAGPAASTYPDIAVAATQGNATPFAGTVRSDLGCGLPVGGTLQTVTAEGTYSVPVTLPTGAPGPVQAFDIAPALAITAASPSRVTSELGVTGVSGLLSDLDVRINVSHTFDGELAASLVAPDGTRVRLVQYRGGGGDNFVNTDFDDEAGPTIAAGAPPFTGSFQPEAPLSTFDGIDPNGTWKLVLVDSASGDGGTLNSWRLSARGAVCSPVPDAPALSTDPASPAADVTPLVKGTAPAGSAVDVYTGTACTGAPAATGSAGQLASGFEITVPLRSTTPIRATATVGGFTSRCSPAVEYVENTSERVAATPIALPSPTATPKPADRDVVLTLTASATQRALKAKGVKLSVVCPLEACAASASGVLTIQKKKLKTGSAKKALKAKEKATLTLKLSKSLTRKLKAALRKKKARISATITVVVTDAAGNRATKSVKVKLRR